MLGYTLTDAEYRKFIEATGYRPPKFWGEGRLKDPDAPVVGVSWYDADKFATWAGTLLDHDRPIVIVAEPALPQLLEALSRVPHLALDGRRPAGGAEHDQGQQADQQLTTVSRMPHGRYYRG